MTENSNRVPKRIKGVIAGAAGVALLLGGSTFALWTASDTLNTSSTIEAGSMSVTAGSDIAIYDVSADRKNTDENGDNATQTATGLPGHAIADVSTLQVVPGDTIAVVYPFTVQMDGDNLVGKLSADISDLTAGLTGATFQYAVKIGYASVGQAKGIANPASVPQVDLGYVTSNADEDAEDLSLMKLQNGTGEASLILYVTFPASVGGTTSMGGTQALANVTLTLTQARDTGKGNFS